MCKKKILIIAASAVFFLALVGCGKNVQPEKGAVSTTVTTVPTDAVALVETPEPTVAPTEEPTAVPTEVPTAVPTVVPTAEPTEESHVHTWTEKETAPTCTEDGLTWKECECGEKSDETTLPATGHGETTYTVVTEPTVEAEGKYETTCNICHTVVESGVIAKAEPTSTPVPMKNPEPTATAAPTKAPEPIATSTPKPTVTPKPTKKPEPTATPKPTKAPEPTRIPVESYTWWDVNHELIRYADESKTELVRVWYDLNLKDELITIRNYTDEATGELFDIPIYDYPSEDAEVICYLPGMAVTKTRGQAKALKRCLENGWYYIEYHKPVVQGGGTYYGYVDGKYVRTDAKSGFSSDGHHCPMYEYCQFEIPYLGPDHELNKIENMTLAVGATGRFGTKSKSLNLYYALFIPDLDMNITRTVGVIEVENPEIIELEPEWSGISYVYRPSFKEGIGYYDWDSSYRSNFKAKSVGTTTVTITEYLVDDFEKIEGGHNFTLGEKLNTVTFTITVTE